MAQVRGEITGLEVEVSSDDERDEDDLSPVEELLFAALRSIKRDQPKAAVASLVDAVNMMARDHGYSAGAYL